MTQPRARLDTRRPDQRARSRLCPDSGPRPDRIVATEAVAAEIAPEVLVCDTSVDETWAKQAEDVFRQCAASARIDCVYEPHSFPQGFVWRGTVNVRPDFFLPGLDLYIEITTGRTLHKIRRLQGAMQVAANAGHELSILLFDGPMMARLSLGSVSIWDLIFRELEQLPDLTIMAA